MPGTSSSLLSAIIKWRNPAKSARSSRRSSTLTPVAWAVLFAAAAATAAAADPPTVPGGPAPPATSGPMTMNPRGCYKQCDRLQLGFFINEPTDKVAHKPAFEPGASYNYERYLLSTPPTDVVQTKEAVSFQVCCARCARNVHCSYWHFAPYAAFVPTKNPPTASPGVCHLLKELTVSTQNDVLSINPSYIGGKCNPVANTEDDPHFKGADGTRFEFNGLLDRSFCLLSDRRVHINMGIKGYRPIANLPGYATSLDDDSLAKALEAAENEKKPRHIRALEQDKLSDAEVAELVRMRENGSLPLTDEVTAALDRETGRGESGEKSKGVEGQQHGAVQYAKHELQAKLLQGKAIRSWIRELQLMWRDDDGEQHSVFLKARDGKQQERGRAGFIDVMEVDGARVKPPLKRGSAVTGKGGFKMLLVATKNRRGKFEDEFDLTIDGVIDLSITARLAHPLMQTPTQAQAHFNVHIGTLNHTEAIHGVLGQTFRGEAQRVVRSLRYRLLTRLLREPVDVESDSGRGFLDGDVSDYVTSSIRAPDCTYAAAWRRGEHERSDGSDFM